MTKSLMERVAKMNQMEMEYAKFETMEGHTCPTCWKKGCDCPENNLELDGFINNYNALEEEKFA